MKKTISKEKYMHIMINKKIDMKKTLLKYGYTEQELSQLGFIAITQLYNFIKSREEK